MRESTLFSLPAGVRLELLAQHLLRPLERHAAIEARADRRKDDQSNRQIHEELFRRDAHPETPLRMSLRPESDERRRSGSDYCISSRILNSGLLESFPSDHATVAPSACKVADRIVTAMSEVQGGAKPDARPNDIGLTHLK